MVELTRRAERWRGLRLPAPAVLPLTGVAASCPMQPLGQVQCEARSWDIDALRCLRCQGRMLVVGVVKDPDVVEAILAAILISKELPATASGPRGPPDRLV